MYKRNLLQYKTEAWSCRKIRHSRKTLTYFFGDEHLLQESKDPIQVSGEECQRMQKWKACEEGTLSPNADLWQTNNQIDLSYPAGGSSCCYWKVVISDNCYMYKAFVYKRHGEKLMESTAGDVSHCKYKQGSCQLKDKTHLVWEPDEHEKCEFMEWKSFDGHKIADSWVSHDGNLALTHKNRKWVTSCEQEQLRMSDQGIPFHYLSISTVPTSHRYKRNYPQNGVVTTELHAASLQALEFDLRNVV